MSVHKHWWIMDDNGGNRVHCMFSHLAIWIHFNFRDSLLNQVANKCCRLLVLSRRGTVVLVDGPEKTPAVCDTVPEDNLGSCNRTCTIRVPCKSAMSTILYLLSVKEKRRWTPAALRRKMLHFHNSTCLFIDFETGGFIRKCMIQVLEVWFRSAKLRRTLSCHDRRARVKDSFNEKWHPIIDILALWAPYIGSWGVLINACWWSHIAYITIPCPEFDHGKWIKPQIVTFQVGLACLIQKFQNFMKRSVGPGTQPPQKTRTWGLLHTNLICIWGPVTESPPQRPPEYSALLISFNSSYSGKRARSILSSCGKEVWKLWFWKSSMNVTTSQQTIISTGHSFNKLTRMHQLLWWLTMGFNLEGKSSLLGSTSSVQTIKYHSSLIWKKSIHHKVIPIVSTLWSAPCALPNRNESSNHELSCPYDCFILFL